jgi:PAS domain S-box-containing protein
MDPTEPSAARGPEEPPRAADSDSPPSREQAEREAALRRSAMREGEAAGTGPRARVREEDAFEMVGQRAFAALADSVRDYAIFLMDPDGVITFWGEGARLINWWTREQAEGSHLRLLYPDGGSEDGTAEEHLRQAAETGEYTGEGHRNRSDGSTFWGGITLTSLRDGDGTLLGFAKVTRDLTARRATEAAREAALRAAEEASRLKSLFLATMSHEIRTPLNAIMAYSDLLGMELNGPLKPAQHDQLGKIRASSQHLLGIVEDVLDLSRIESGRLVVDRARLDVGSVITQALVLVHPQASARQVELVDAVSGVSAGQVSWGDEERVRQILVNLLTNAVKFTEPGGRITVSAGSAARLPPGLVLAGPGPWIFVRVEDTGQGIPPERVDEVFEPFVQADMRLTRQHGGTGLGLSISRRLARLMGGDLTVRSEVGVGSTFLLWLHAAPATPPEPAGELLATPRSAGVLREIRGAILAELERILHGYVARVRGDPAIPSAHALPEAELEDHLASFLSDLAQTVGAMDLGAGVEADSLRDGTAIQRTIAERHGRQRARLGWRATEVRREFQILREELAAAVRRQIHPPRPEELDEALGILDEFLAGAQRVSQEGLQLEREE